MSWKRIFIIAGYTFFKKIKSPLFYIQTFISFVVFVFLSLIFMLILAGLRETLELPVGFVDHSGLLSVLSLEEEEKESVDFLIYSSMEEAQADLRDHRIRALVEIPPDYLESGRILIWVYGTSPWPFTAFERTESLLRKAVVQNRLDPRIVRRVIEPIDQLSIISADQVKELGDSNLPGQIFGQAGVQVPRTARFLIQISAKYILQISTVYILVTFLLLNISLSATYGYENISQDRANRVGELMLSAVSATEWLIGKIFGVVLSTLTKTLIEITIWLGILGGASWWLLGDPALFSPKEVGLALIYCVLGMMFYVSVSMFTILVHPKLNSMLLTILGLLNPVIMAVVIAPSSRIAVFLSFFPLTAPGTMVVRVLLGSAPWHDVVISLIGLGVCLMGMIKAGSVVASRVLIPGMPVLSIPTIRRQRS